MNTAEWMTQISHFFESQKYLVYTMSWWRNKRQLLIKYTAEESLHDSGFKVISKAVLAPQM